MKLLCIGDIHGDVARYPVPSLPDADYVVLAGDLTDRGINDPAQVAAVEAWLDELRLRYTYVLYILGNHDEDMADDYFDHERLGGIITSVDCTMFLRAGHSEILPFRLRSKEQMAADPGFSGTKGVRTLIGLSLSPCFDMPHLESYYDRMTGDPEIDAAGWRCIASGGRFDIIVSHAPPHGILDETDRRNDDESARHIGSPGLKTYIETKKPRLVICGHVHEAAGVAFHHETTIVNCARRAILVEITDAGNVIIGAETQKVVPS